MCEYAHGTVPPYARARRCPVVRYRLVRSAYARARRCPVLRQHMVLPAMNNSLGNFDGDLTYQPTRALSTYANAIRCPEGR
eukprot:2701808-Rhodomonas_salina.7